MTITTDLGSGTLAEVQGLHEDTQTTLQDLQDTLNNILEAVTGISGGGTGGGFSEDMGDKVKGALGNKGDKKEGGGNKKGDQPTNAKADVKINDLNGLPQSFTMGALLLNTTLLGLQKALLAAIEKVKGAGNQSAKGLIASNKQVNNTKNVGTEINMDPKKMDGITKALLEFGKACIILSLIPQRIVKNATKLFKDFMIDMASIAILVAKQGGDLDNMGKGIKSIVESIKPFALGCLLLTLLLPSAIIATYLGLPLLKMFIESMLGIAQSINPKKLQAIKELGTFMIKVSIALLLFTIDLVLLEKVLPKIPKAIVGLIIFVVFIGLMVLIGLLASFGTIPVGFLGTFSITLSISLILFSVALMLMSKIQVKPEVIASFVDNVSTLSMGMMNAIFPLIMGTIAALLLVTFSALLFLGALLLIIDTALLLVISKITDDKAFKTDGKSDMPVIASIKKIVKGFASLPFMIDVVIGAVSLILFIIFSALLLIAGILFLIDIVLLLVINVLMDFIIKGEGDEAYCPPILGAVIIAKDFARNIGWFILGAISAIPAAIFAVALMVFSVAMLVSVAAMAEIVKFADKLDSKTLKSTSKKVGQIGIGMMLGFLGVDSDKIGIKSMIEAGINSVKMIALAVLACAAVIPTSIFIVSLATIATAFKKLEENMQGVTPSTIESVMGSVGIIMEQLGNCAKAFANQSAETIQAVGSLVKDVATAIDMLVGTVQKLKDGIPEDQINAATSAMKLIVEKLFGRVGEKTTEEGEYTLVDTLETIASADLEGLNVEAIGAIVPLMDGIDRMCDVVVRISDEGTFSEDVITRGATNLARFLDLMQLVALSMQFLVKKVPSGETEKAGGLKGLFGGRDKVMKSPLDAINEVVNAGLFSSMETVFNGLQGAVNVIKGLNVDDIDGVAKFLAGGTIDKMAVNGPKFHSAMSEFAIGIKALDATSVDNFSKFIRVLSSAKPESIVSTVNALSNLGKYATQFKSTADSFERMAKAIEKMGKSEGKVSKMFESLKSGAKASADLEKSTAAATGGTTFNPYVEKIYDVLDDWCQNGVPIRGDDNGQIAPIKAGNTVGGSLGR